MFPACCDVKGTGSKHSESDAAANSANIHAVVLVSGGRRPRLGCDRVALPYLPAIAGTWTLHFFPGGDRHRRVARRNLVCPFYDHAFIARGCLVDASVQLPAN